MPRGKGTGRPEECTIWGVTGPHAQEVGLDPGSETWPAHWSPNVCLLSSRAVPVSGRVGCTCPHVGGWACMHQHVKLAECESTHVPCVCRCVPTCKGAWDSLGRGEDKAPNNIPTQTWLLDVGALSPQGAWSPGLIHVALSQVWAEHCAPPWPWPPTPKAGAALASTPQALLGADRPVRGAALQDSRGARVP